MTSAIYRERAQLAFGLLLAVVPVIATFEAVPRFNDVFQSLGGQLPLVTSLALRFYPALLALPLFVIAAWLVWPQRERRGLAALIMGAGGFVLVPLLLAAAMYLPVMRLGS